MHTLETRIKAWLPLGLSITGAVFCFALTNIRGLESTHYPDAILFINQAEAITQGWAYMLQDPMMFRSPLGFSGLLSTTFLLSGGSSLALFKLFLSICHGLSTFLVTQIGIRMGLPRLFWAGAALLFSLDPFVLFAATDIQVESLVTLSVLFWAYLFLVPSENRKATILQAVGFSVSGFVAVTIRPNILIPFILLSIFLFRIWFTRGTKWSLYATAISIFFGFLTLYEILLAKLYGGFVFLSTNGGLNALLACRKQFLPQYLGLISVDENRRINSEYYSYLENLRSSIISQQPKISFSQLDHEYLSRAISSCTEDPVGSSFVLIAKSLAIWRPFTVIGAYGIEIAIISFLVWLPLTILAIWYLSRRNLSVPNLILRNYFLILSIGFTISLLPSSTQIRHRVAFVEPFLWLFTAFFLAHKFDNESKRLRKKPDF
jgi:hypothetical protein